MVLLISYANVMIRPKTPRKGESNVDINRGPRGREDKGTQRDSARRNNGHRGAICGSGLCDSCARPASGTGIFGKRPGTCPRPSLTADQCLRRPRVYRTCDIDADCRGGEKCCFNGCGSECIQVVARSKLLDVRVSVLARVPAYVSPLQHEVENSRHVDCWHVLCRGFLRFMHVALRRNLCLLA
ncbi:hypothetical protein Bbelb_166690 [Branchiostoma belcheri]|nr:hypothetical protein Bbelb_166690 [Branchiostoma belcheri]